jgi:hypothetical protein
VADHRAGRGARGVQGEDGWRFPWVSSLGGDFKYDRRRLHRGPAEERAEFNFRHVDIRRAAEGMSAFGRGRRPPHLPTYDRGVDALMGTFQYLDSPLGRDPDGPAQAGPGGGATTSTRPGSRLATVKAGRRTRRPNVATRNGSAQWNGNLMDGSGTVTVGDGVWSGIPSRRGSRTATEPTPRS